MNATVIKSGQDLLPYFILHLCRAASSMRKLSNGEGRPGSVDLDATVRIGAWLSRVSGP